MHIKRIHEMMEDLTAYAECEVKKAIECESYDVNVIGGIIDMVKDLADAEKNARIAKAMQTEEEDEEAEEKYLLKEFIDKLGEDDGRRFYDRWRYKSGRFAPKGRGHRSGYTPLIHMPYLEEDMYDYEHDFPKMPNYRMGYPMDSMRNIEWRDGMMYDGREGSRHGKAYDDYKMQRRHYTESKDAESKRRMEESMKEYTEDVMENMKEMWKDADPQLRQTMKADLTKMIQQLQ